ncbi:Serine/threonine-protein kinase ULK2 [Fasciola hepatica]|uniref:Serine/threonine-protein kinase ULK2 n=1 Tax=Fasciola hepatica TaxID=6192 RepID=A0A4E0S0M7_FASHE|nr:Serine/threonine-protein kinase ULK2 [Fasciola hepatica]
MMAVTMCGSPMYMAPEVLMCRKYDAVADIWSMGIIVYQCLTGKAPFYASNPEALKNIYETSPCLKPKIPVTTSQLLRDLLLRMLVRKPSDRIDFAGAKVAGGVAANTPNRARRDLPSRAESGNTVIGTLGQGTGDGPYYLTSRNQANKRDKTPQRNPTVNKVHPPTHLAGRTFIPSSASPAYVDTQHQPSSNPNIDEVDDEMSRTTVDEYFEDELDSSTLPLETSPPTRMNYGSTVPEPVRGGYNVNAPPVPCRGSSVAWKNIVPNAHQTHLGHSRPPMMSTRPSAELETDENHVDDFVLVNAGDTEIDRYSRALPYPRTEHYPLSHVGQIVTNPTAYLANHPRLQRTESPPLPDVTVVGDKGDDYIPLCRTAIPSHKGHAIPGGFDNATAGMRVGARPPSFPVILMSFTTVTDPDPPGRTTTRGPSTTPVGPTDPASFRGHPVKRGRETGQWPQQTEPNATRASNKSDQIRLANRVTPTGIADPSALGHVSGEFATGAHPIRIRPYSGGGILEYAANVPNGLLCGGVWAATEFSDEQLMDSQHNEAIKTITMVLELCELLTELAERRASVLSDCVAAPAPVENTQASLNAATDPDSQNESPVAQSDTETDSSTSTGGLKFLSEAQRIVEQIVLYRRVLYYLEYVFDQVKKSCKDRRLKSTATARQCLRDCNTLYHRCYIRLRQLARQSRRDDLIEPVGRLLANITANRLIFQYALVQSLQRYKAGITLLHGLRQHARTNGDITLLNDCMRLLHDRITALRTTAAKGHRDGCLAHSGGFADPSSSPASDRSGTPLTRVNPLDRSFGDSPSGADCSLAEASPLASSPIR